jgi:hypothetical protein
MNLVQKQMVHSHGIQIVGKVENRVCGEPHIIHRYIESIIRIVKGFKNMLKNQGRFTHALLTLDSQHTHIPVNLAVKVSFKTQSCLSKFPVVNRPQRLNVILVH